jgi:hypothetical protein
MEWLRSHQHNHEGYDEARLGQWLADKASPEQLNNRQIKHPAYTTESGEGRQLLPWQKTAAVYLTWKDDGTITHREYQENMYNLLIFNGIVTDTSRPQAFTQPAANDEVITSGPVERGKELVLRDVYNIGGLFDEYTESWFQRQRLMFTLEQQLNGAYSPEAIDGISPEQLDAHVKAFMARYEEMKVKDKVASIAFTPRTRASRAYTLPVISEMQIAKRFTEADSGLLLPDNVYNSSQPIDIAKLLPARA